MTRSIWLAAGLVLAGASGAASQGPCPEGIARDGVWLEFPDRSVLSRVLSDGRVQDIEFAHDGSYIFGYVTLPNGLLVDGWGLENGYVPSGDRETVSYVGTPDPVPAPAPGVRFDGIEVSRYADGSETRSSVNLVVGQPQEVVIGGCSYTGLPVEVTRIDLAGGVSFNDSMMHMPDLGVTIYIGFSEGNAPRLIDLPTSISYEPPPAGGSAQPPMAPAPEKIGDAQK